MPRWPLLPVVETGIAEEELGRIGYFSPILNMASGSKHDFFLPFGNMSFTEEYSTQTSCNTNKVHALQYFLLSVLINFSETTEKYFSSYRYLLHK